MTYKEKFKLALLQIQAYSENNLIMGGTETLNIQEELDLLEADVVGVAKFVTNVMVGNEEVGIYRTGGDVLIGLDGCFLEQMDDDETIESPYGDGSLLLDDEV